MTEKKQIVWVLLLNLLIALAVWLWIDRAENQPITCEGSLVFKDRRLNNQFTFEGMVVMHFIPDGSGHFSLNGDIVLKHNHWTVSRQQNFSWQHIHDAFYQLHIQQVERFGYDDVPAGILEKYAIGITQDQKRLVNIQRTADNAVVISNDYSPLLICAG